jgi:hypothetical protein
MKNKLVGSRKSALASPFNCIYAFCVFLLGQHSCNDTWQVEVVFNLRLMQISFEYIILVPSDIFPTKKIVKYHLRRRWFQQRTWGKYSRDILGKTALEWHIGPRYRTKFSHRMGNLPQKISFLFLGLFYSYRKKKHLCTRNFFNSGPFSPRKLDLKIQK